MNQHTKRRVLHLCAVAASGLIAASNARDLADYDVPIPLVAVCALAIFCVLHQLACDLVDRFVSDRFACSDCDFTVTLSGADAGDVARWRETAADHPHHMNR